MWLSNHVAGMSTHDNCSSAKAFNDVFERASRSAQQIALQEERDAVNAVYPSGVVDISDECTLMQSSRYIEAPSHRCPGRVRDGTFGFHTELEDKPWILLDLREHRQLDSIVLFNRIDPQCKLRANRLVVAYSQDGADWIEHHKTNGVTFGGIDGHPLRIVFDNLLVRFIRMHLNERNLFHLDQISILAR